LRKNIYIRKSVMDVTAFKIVLKYSGLSSFNST
jgi:hypothetical protein